MVVVAQIGLRTADNSWFPHMLTVAKKRKLCSMVIGLRGDFAAVVTALVGFRSETMSAEQRLVLSTCLREENKKVPTSTFARRLLLPSVSRGVSHSPVLLARCAVLKKKRLHPYLRHLRIESI